MCMSLNYVPLTQQHCIYNNYKHNPCRKINSDFKHNLKMNLKKDRKDKETLKLRRKKKIAAYFPFAYASVKLKDFLLNHKAAQSTKQTVEEGTVPMLSVLQI